MARIERVNYDTYIKPLEHIQKAHNDTLADMANMSQQSEILDYYLDPELDKESYNLYNNFKNEFNAQATDFAKNGYTRNNGARLLNLHRNYNRNVGNVLDAVKNREAERAEQHKLFADSNGQVVFGNGQNADEKSVDDYLRGNKGYVFQNLDEVYKYAKNQASAASKREYKDGVADAVKVLDNNYYKILEETGYDTQAAYEKLDAMMADVANQLDLTYNPNNDPNIDPKDDPAGLIRNMREELRRRGLENYSNEDKHKIISSFLTGTYEGLGYEPKLTMKETEQMAKARRAVNNVNVHTGEIVTTNETRVNENELPIVNTFKDPSSPKKRQETFDLLTGVTRYGNRFANMLIPLYDNTNQGDGNANKLATFEEFLSNCSVKFKKGKDQRGNEKLYVEQYKVSTDPDAMPEKEFVPAESSQYYRTYNHLIDELKNMYKLSDEQISSMKKGNVKPILQQQIDQINEWNNGAVKQPSYELKINPDDTSTVFETTWSRGAAGPITGGFETLGYNPETGEWSFANPVESSTLKKYSDSESSLKKGTVMSIIYSPIGDELYHVEFRSRGFSDNGEEVKSVYFPLSAFASMSGSKEAKMLSNAAQSQKVIINAIKKKLSENPNINKKEELALQLKKAQVNLDTINKHIIIESSQRALNSEKDIKDDELRDLVTMKPLKE